MRAVIPLVLAIVCLGFGCRGDDRGARAPVGVEAAAVQAYQGPLDKDRFHRAREALRPFMSWDDARRLLSGIVGLPGRERGDRRFWAVIDGERCLELVVENAGGQVGMVGVMSYDPAMKQAFGACVTGLRTDIAQAAPARSPDRREAPAAAAPEK